MQYKFASISLFGSDICRLYKERKVDRSALKYIFGVESLKIFKIQRTRNANIRDLSRVKADISR
jgi:hypothetical protein